MKIISLSIKVLLCSGLLAAWSAQAITVDFRIKSTSSSSYTTDVFITNDTSSAINGWSLSMRLGGTVKSYYSASMSGSNPYTFTNASHNGNIGAGGNVSFGFTGNGSFSASGLADCRINGQTCTFLVNGQPIGGASSSSSSRASSSSSSRASSSVASSSGANAVFTERFESLSGKWRNVDDTAVTSGCGVGGGKCLRVSYRPTPAAGENGTPVLQTMIPIPSAREYSFSYDLMFESGWEWVRGGKLPGLAATVHDSGCSQTPGADKWSARIMWRESAENEIYVYRQGRAPGACGDRNASNRKFVVGSYQAVTVYVRVNSNSSTSDGLVRLYINGALAAEQSGVKLRGTNTTASEVSNIMFSTFFGGTNRSGQATWSPSKTVYARFDNLVVTPGLRVRASPGN